MYTPRAQYVQVVEEAMAETVRARDSYMKVQAPVQLPQELQLLFATVQFRKAAQYSLPGRIQNLFQNQLMSSQGR